MIRVSVMGAADYVGFELVKMLLKHKFVSITRLTDSLYSGSPYSSIYPSLKGVIDITVTGHSIEDVAKNSDFIFMCMPDGTAMQWVSELKQMGKKVIDLSADYRFYDSRIYDSVYNTTHTAPSLLDTAAYGLAEINSLKIKQTDIIAIPGYYPSSVLVPLIPLIKDGIVDYSDIIIDSKAGVSCAGSEPLRSTHFCSINENIKPYGIFNHRHKPEIEHIIKYFTEKDANITFIPHLIPVARGVLSVIYIKNFYPVSRVKEALSEVYNASPFIRLVDSVPSIASTACTPYIDIGVYQTGRQLIIITSLDNLMKGSASQAMQCFNINMGFDIRMGIL